MSLADPVVYQIYPRSFQDSNGDGIGDLRGIISRLDYLQHLGVDAIWLSPIFKSPMADFGYDVSDYCDIAPEFGTLDDAKALIDETHARGMKFVLDMILGHTSIENPWFREHPDMYIRADKPLNNWTSVFGGSMWSPDPDGDGYYMHRFYPAQPDLNWRNPKTRQAMYRVMHFWEDKGVDGFRLDAIDGLYRRADLADMPVTTERFPLRLDEASTRTGYDSSLPELFEELARLRNEFPDSWFVTEAFRPVDELGEYTEHMDCSFNFDFLLGSLDAASVADVLQRSSNGSLAWALSNHDFSRLVTRAGRELARVAAVMLMSLPGAAFIYQGDEIGMVDGSGGPNDEMGRDKFRHPMQWTSAGGFTDGKPWLPMTDPATCNAADQESDPDSMLAFYRKLIQLRKSFEGGLTDISATGNVLRFARQNIVVVCNLGVTDEPFEEAGHLLIDTRPTTHGILPAHSAVILGPSGPA